MGSEFFNDFIVERFKALNTSELILNETFRKIVTCEIGEGDTIKILIEKLPAKKDEISLAYEILKGLQTPKVQNTAEKKKQLWNQLKTAEKSSQLFQHLAASLLILFIIVTVFYLSQTSTTIEDVTFSNEIDSNEITLILASGEQFILNKKPYKIKHHSDGSFFYAGNKSKFRSATVKNVFYQMIVPYGKRSDLLLSDGTKVWLNSGSRLIYPPAFEGKFREVFLEGEAFFEVAKDLEKPFYVKTDAFRLRVYGTRFDVRAYKKTNDFTTSLVEGKISLTPNQRLLAKEVFLLPNQKAISSTDHKTFKINEVHDLENMYSWVDGYLSFDNESISKVIQNISHYYNVPIGIKIRNNDLKITGKLELKDEVERVISGLMLLTKTKYLKDNNKFLIYQ